MTAPQSRNSLRGWLAASAAFLSMGISIGASQYAFGHFIEPLEQSFGWTRTQISASLSFTAVGTLAAPLIGRLMDVYGARPIMVGSLLMMGTSFVLRPLMSELWHWYVLSFIQLVPFAGMTILPAGRLIGLWFRRTRGRMMGITNAGANFGGLVIPPATALVLAIGTWRDAYIAMGLGCFAIALYSLLVVRERPLGSTARPEDTGGPPGSEPEPGEGAEEESEEDAEEEHWTTRRALRTRSFYAIAIAVCLGCFTYATILPHVVVHLTNEGAGITVASLALAMLAISGIAGKVGFGFLAERFGARKTFIVDLLGQAVAVLCLAFAPSPLLMLAITPVYGFFMGGTGVLLLLIVQETFGLRHYGAILGLINMSTIVTFTVGPLLAGASFDLTGSYSTAFGCCCAFFLCAAAVLQWTRDDAGATPRTSRT